ncbi:MAG: AIR synthase [Mucilaginibacter polytrichastri]|nr:AIR synthase [Mucilaginibacter polytrichastri]
MSNSGKIGEDTLGDIILPFCGARRDDVLCGPAFGVDISLLDLPDGLALAVASDPLTLIPALGLQESAWLSVHLLANDMATTGFAPQFAQFVLNLPPSLTQNDFREYWRWIDRYCSDIGLAITGGHTGIVPGQESTIAGGGTFFLTAPRRAVKLSSDAKAGDAIIVTKGCAYSSAAILSKSFPETVRDRCGRETADHCAGLFYQTSSLRDALIANAAGGISAMHDVTEGGVLGAIYEMAVASGNGVLVNSDALPRDKHVSAVCALFDIDERFCIGAGSMIIAVEKTGVKKVLNALAADGIFAADAGEFLPAGQGKILSENGIDRPLPYYQKDPYWAAFFNAQKKGWK